MHEQKGRNFSIINACEIVLGEVSDHVLEEVLKIREGALSQKKVSTMKKASKIFGAMIGKVGGGLSKEKLKNKQKEEEERLE
jgi:hypothetical protein